MLESLFSILTHAINGSAAVALLAAFAWGVLSILLSPCHLASIPLIVGFIDDQGRVTSRRAAGLATSFAVGILLSIAIIGAITVAAGRMAGDLGGWVNYALAAVFLIVGLHLMDVLPLPLGALRPGSWGKGLLAAFTLGGVFGIALGPCTFAYMAPILGVVFKLSSTGVLYGMLLLLAYGIGHCAVIALAGSSTGWVQKYLSWNHASEGVGVIKKLCGVLVILGGLSLLYTA